MDLNIFVVQPVTIAPPAFLKVLPRPVSRKEVVAATKPPGNQPHWLTRLRGRTYAGALRSLDVEIENNSDAWKADLLSRFGEDLGPLMISSILFAPRVELFFDSRFDYFILTYQFSFRFDSVDDIEKIFQVFSPEYNHDSYNLVRNILVKETDDQKAGAWVEGVKKSCLKAVQNQIRKFYGLRLPLDDIFVANNTGNISWFFDEIPSGDIDRLRKHLHLLHNTAEIKARDIEPIELPRNTTHIFGGRFHTIISEGDEVFRQYGGIQFHVQFMYIYLQRIYELGEYLSDNVILNGEDSKAQSLRPVFEDLIVKVEQLSIYNEFFKMAIENDSERLYEKVQSRWNIEGLLSQTGKFVGFFREYLSRLHEQEEKKYQKRVNSILAVIASLQLFGLVSIWIDYLSIFSTPRKDIVLFGWDVTQFTAFLPVGIVVLIIIPFLLFWMIRLFRS